MSLIHEALKRAEADKLHRSPYFDNLTVLPGDRGDGPPPPPLPPESREEPDRPRRRRVRPPSASTVLLLAAMTGCGAACAWYISRLEKAPTGPRPAAAADGDRAPATGAPAATASAAPAPPAPAAAPAPRPPHNAANDEARLAIARTMEAARYYEPAAARPPARPASAPAPAEPPKPPKAEPPEPTPVYIDTSQFRLSGIICGPDENVAIINGHPTRAGQTVLGAKVIRIERDRVEMLLAGRQFSIQL